MTIKAAFRVIGGGRGTLVVASDGGPKDRVWWVRDETGETTVVEADAVNYGGDRIAGVVVISDGGRVVWDFTILSRIPVPEGTTSMVFNQVNVSVSLGAK